VTAASMPAGGGETPGQVYLLHLDPPVAGHAGHYQHSTHDLDARLEAHREGRGARLLEVQKERGGTFRLVRTWPGGRGRERAIKDRHEGPRLCPECSPQPKPVEHGRSGPAAGRATPAPAVPEPAGPLPAPVRAGPYLRGGEMARQFLRGQAGRTADQISATRDYVTGPWREMAHHTAAPAETYRGYMEAIEQHLAGLRAAAPAAGKDRQYELEAGQ
jgi:predicted GIY-YIG superfamily endonuclease